MTDGSKLSDLAALGGTIAGTDLVYLVRGLASYKALVSQFRFTLSQLSDASANGQSFVAAADYAAMRTLLSLGTLATLNSVAAAQIGAKAVMLAKMDDLADGYIIKGDGSNRPAAVLAGALALLNTIGTSHIDDEAVTPAKMSDLTEDSVLIGDNTNRPDELPLSTLGKQLLQSDPGTTPGVAGDDESIAYTGIDNAQAGTPYATISNLNALRVAYEDLRAEHNALVSALESFGIIA